MKTSITLEFDSDSLSYVDGYLAALWHAAQWNSKPGADREACETAERIGREIIRRWLASVEPELWHRQGSHAESLPAIERNAKVQNVLRAARAVVAADHAANIPAYRERSIAALEELESKLKELGE